MAIGETFLSAFLQVLFEQLLTGGIEFLKLIGGVDLPKIIKKWKKDLTLLEALLEDAELQQFHSKPVKLWLNDLQDLAYDMEDLLDHFAIEAQRYELKKAEEDQVHAVLDDHSHHGILDNMVQTIYASGSRAAGSLSTLFNPVDQDIREKIDDISERLQDIKDQTQSLSLTAAHMLQQQTLQTETLRSDRESASSVGSVFGREDKKKEIMTLLLNDDQSSEGYVVIPIVGTGGIGKTTLAQYVYRDEQKYVYKDEQLYANNEHKCNFDLKAWVCVSDVFDVKRVTKDIINSLTNSNIDCSTLDRAQVKLQEELKGKKFFIVLDDVWSEKYDDWYKLQIPFQHGAKGSRVIITTRSKSIAKKTTKNHNNIIHLQGLSNDDCWCLFQHHANENTDNPKMKNDIVRKCKGLPLAARALGGLLKCTTEESQRRKILESSVWAEEYDEECSVLPVLRLSYHHLPSHLKRVFAYCSVLPKDYWFEEMEIIQLWMAQGFLPDNKDRRMEDRGHDYFNNLVSRSLFEKCTFSYGRRFTMHDLIHDVAHIAAGSICNVMDDTDSRTELRRTRHLFVTRRVQTLGNQITASQLRTFLSGYGLKINYFDFFTKIRHVRTLSLCSLEIKTLPECIGDLKHLRYLRLVFNRTKELPPSIGNLWNLQTLCLNGCNNLEKVPCIESLEKLRHLYICSTSSLMEMPLGIEKLTNLQTLDKFVLAVGGGSRVRELGKLHQLCGRSIIVSGLENVIEVNDAEEAHLSKNENLAKLYLKWGTCFDMVDDKTRTYVVEKLRPHTSIKECKLDGYMGSKFPSWLGDPSFINMVDIELKNCQKSVCLPLLGNLPSLKRLLIEDMNSIKKVDIEFYGNCSTPFPSLKTLRVSRMKSWEEWVHPPVVVDNINKAFPILEELSIEGCPSLQGDLPPHLPSLRSLEINGFEQLQSLELKSLFTSTSHLEEVIVSRCKSMVSIGQIPLTLKLLKIHDCEKLEYVEFDEQPTNLFPGSDDEKDLQSEEIEGVSPKATLELPFLTKLSIQRCPNLISLQQSLLFPALQDLQLRVLRMKSWEEWVHPPVVVDNINKAFPMLEKLSIEDCPSLQGDLPSHLPSLRSLEINGVEQLQSLELKSLFTSTSHLEEVIVSGCKSMVSIGQIPLTLKLLEIDDCEKLEYVEFDEHHVNLSCESDDEKGLKSEESIGVSSKVALELPLLTELKIERCPSLISLQQNLLLPALRDLKLRNCKNMEWLPGELHNITSLKELSINKCPKIHRLAEVGLPRNLTSLAIEEVNISQAIQIIECIPCPHLSFPSSLSKLEINGFQNLKTISFNCSTFPNLTSLSIRDCPRLESLLGDFTSITNLSISNCPMLESLFGNFASLKFLFIENCPEIRNFLEGGLPTNLETIQIRGTKIDKPIKEWGLHLLTSLQWLSLENVGSCVDTIESISYPDFPSSLESLMIEGFQNLKTICCSTLPILFWMNIRNCPKLESFGDNGLPPRINDVYIKECDMIEQQLTSDPNGPIEKGFERFSLPPSGSQPSSAQTTC